MKVTATLILFSVLAAFALTGCEKDPKNLSAEYKPGVCVVCQKNTKVKDIMLNPDLKYSVQVCWRKECQDEFSANMSKYVDVTKLPTVIPNGSGNASATPSTK